MVAQIKKILYNPVMFSDNQKITFQSIVIIFLASCFYFYEFILQVSPGTLQQDLMKDFAIDATKFGLLSGFFYLAYTPLQLLSGLLLDRYSTRIILTCICAIFASGALLFAHAPNIYVAILARFIMGGAASCAFISVLHLTAYWIPAIHFALFAGITEMMGGIGGLSGTLLTLLLKSTDWRIAIARLSYAGFVLAMLIFLVVRSSPKAKNINQNINTNTIKQDLKTILSNAATWFVGLYSCLIWAPTLGFSALWAIEFLRLNHGIDKIIASQIVACSWLGIAISCPAIGWLSDLIKKRCVIMAFCAFAGTVALLGIIFTHNLPVWMLATLLFTMGFASSGQTLSFALIKDFNPSNTIGAANGFNNMFLVSSGLVFQPLIGRILDIYWLGEVQNGVHIYSLHGYQMAFSILALCYFLAMLIGMFFIKDIIKR